MQKLNLFLKDKVFIILFLSFILWISVCQIYLFNFDKYEITTDKRINHQMIKGDAGKYWSKAHNLIEQVIDGKNPIIAGIEYRENFLYQRLLGFYGYLFDMTFYNFGIKYDKSVPFYSDKYGGQIIPPGEKFGFLLLQAIFFYICLWFYYKNILYLLPKRIAIISTVFLAIEPTIFHSHIMYLTESITFSLLLLLLGTFARPFRNMKIKYLLLGLIIGLLFLQRSLFIYYSYTFIIIAPFIFGKKGILHAFILIIIVYLFTFSVGLHNYYRSGFFYTKPFQGLEIVEDRLAMWVLADTIIANHNKPDMINEVPSVSFSPGNFINKLLFGMNRNERNSLRRQSKSSFEQKTIEIALNEGILDTNDLSIKFSDISEEKRYKWNILKKDMSIIILKENPLNTFKQLIFNYLYSFRYSFGDPFWTFSFYFDEYKRADVLLGRNLFDNSIIKRIIHLVYGLLIMGIIIIGVFSSIKLIDTSLSMFLALSILYIFIVGGSGGGSRHMFPIICFYSIYFAFGVEYLYKYIKNKDHNYEY